MFTHAKQYLVGSSLNAIQGSRDKKNQQNRIARDVCGTDPHCDYRLSRDDQNSGDRQHNQGTSAITNDKNSTQFIEITGRVKMARHWTKDLGNASNKVGSVIHQPGSHGEIGDCSGGQESSDHQCVGTVAQTCSHQDHQSDNAVIKDISEGVSVDEASTEIERQGTQYDNGIHRGRNKWQSHRDCGN